MTTYNLITEMVRHIQSLLTLTASPHARDPRQFWILKSTTGFYGLFVNETEFWIPNVSEFPDSLSCNRDSKAGDSGFDNSNFLDSGFHKQKFSRVPLHSEKPLFTNTACFVAPALFTLFSYR